jgi:exodeoxyribonuclease VII small subunit
MTTPEEPGFDEILTKLRDVVGRLEQGNLSLEQSLKAYEEGIALARRGHEMLDQAEKRVELLVRDADGRVKRVAMDSKDSPAE